MTMHINIYTIIGLFVLLVVGGIVVNFVVKTIKKRSEEKEKAVLRAKQEEVERKKVDRWVEMVEAARSAKEILQIPELTGLKWQWTGDRYNRARKKYEKIKTRAAHDREIADLVDPVLKTDEVFPLLIAFLNVLRSQNKEACEKLGLSPIRIRLLIPELFQRALEGAMKDRDVFMKLHKLQIEYSEMQFDQKRSKVPKIWSVKSLLDYDCPEWDDLVAIHLKSPSISDFLNINRDPAPGKTRLQAAEALRTRSIKDAKIVLALCNIERKVWVGSSSQAVWPHRDEIGDVLLADLAKMVDELHQEQGLFAQLEQEM